MFAESSVRRSPTRDTLKQPRHSLKVRRAWRARFARKFAAYKATHSLHRHASMKSEADAKAVALHGVAAGSRMAKTTQHRSSKEVPLAGVFAAQHC